MGSALITLGVFLATVAITVVMAIQIPKGFFPIQDTGVILGISILAFASRLAQFADDVWGLELDFLRPGLPLVVAGQFSYIVSIATLTIAARLKRFDTTLEEAAFNLGASRAAVLWTVTLPYLKPALIGAVEQLIDFVAESSKVV